VQVAIFFNSGGTFFLCDLPTVVCKIANLFSSLFSFSYLTTSLSNTMVIHDTFADLLLFVYVHMSESDHNYDPSEMAVIKEKMKKLFPAGTDLERKLYHTIREYNSFDKSKLHTLLADSFEHFDKNGSSLKIDMIKDIKEIFTADGSINHDEAEALETLKEIIDHHTS
jgi:uncharacterized tellurite resistance protein B-like protein